MIEKVIGEPVPFKTQREWNFYCNELEKFLRDNNINPVVSDLSVEWVKQTLSERRLPLTGRAILSVLLRPW